MRHKCVQVVVEENADTKSGYKVQLHFAQNPWFSNGVLEKAVRYCEDGSAELTAVPPQWYRGKVSSERERSIASFPAISGLIRCVEAPF